MKDRLLDQLLSAFRVRFGAQPLMLARAPGRVNLMGEHTDYNQGFVLPVAIDRAIYIAMRPRQDNTIIIQSMDFQQEEAFSLDDLENGGPTWVEYIMGVAWGMQISGLPLTGWEGVVGGNIPIGAGLSSSAALEMAVVRIFYGLSKLPWDPLAAARIGQMAETEWVGVQCGIMDQAISAAGKAGHALLLDCRSLRMQYVPLPSACQMVVLDTTTRRALVASAYNERREECALAAEYLGVVSLRDVSLDEFEARSRGMEMKIRRRARHVVSENQRTLEAAQAMQRGDVVTLGRLMNLTHASLRDDYEVSTPELNIMAELAQQQPACYGARLTGAGYGGCVVAFVRMGEAQRFAEIVSQAYERATSMKPVVYLPTVVNGAEFIFLD